MSVQAGIRLGVEGEREYRNAINNINQQTKELKSEMDLLTSSFDKNASAEEKNAAKAQLFQKQIENQSNKVEVLTDKYNREQTELARLKAEMERATAEYGANSKEAQAATTQYNKFATQTSKTKTELNRAKTDLNKMSKEFEEAQNPTKEEAEALDDVSDNLEDAGKNGSVFGDVLKANVVSDIIVGGVKALASAVASIAKGVRDAVGEVVQWADDLATLSVQTGISTDKLQEMEYMANLVDVDVDTITGSLSRMTRNMGNAAEGTGDAAEAFEKLGIHVTDSDGNLRDAREVFYEAVDVLGGMENATERDAAAMAIFGRSAQELNPLIAAGSETLEAFASEAHEVGYVLGEDALGPMLSASDALDRIGKAGETIKRTLVAALSPAFAKTLETIVPAVQEVASAVGSLTSGEIDMGDFVDLVFGWVDSFGQRIQAKLPEIVASGGKVVSSLVRGIATQIPELLNTAADVVLTLTNGLIAALPMIGTGAVDLVVMLVNTIAAQSETLIQTATDMAVALISGLLSADTLTSIVKAAVGLVEAVVSGVLSAIPEVVKAAPKVVVGLIEGMMESAVLVAEAGIELITALVDNLPYIIDTLAESMGELVSGLILALVELTPRLAEAGVDLLVALVQNAPAIIWAVVQIIPKIVEGIVTALVEAGPELADAGLESFSHLGDHFAELWEQLKQDGKEAIDNFIAGVLSMWNSLKSAGREAVGKFGDGIKEIFPDAWQWGRDMIDNFRGGINSAYSGLRTTVTNVAHGIRNILGFSEPEEGPLSNFHTYGPDMMRLYAQGIRDNAYLVEDAARSAALGAAGVFGTTNQTAVNYGGVNITVNANDEMTAQEIAEAVMEQMQSAVERKGAVFA